MAEKYYLLQIGKNKWDAFGFSRIGQFYEQVGEYDKASEYFAKAVALDPKNIWNYYLDDLRMLIQLKKEKEIEDLSAKIKVELKQYLPKVKANTHYTAQTDNPVYALKVLALLKKVDSHNRDYFEQSAHLITQSIAKYNP